MKALIKFFSLTVTEKFLLIRLLLYILRIEIALVILPYSYIQRVTFSQKPLPLPPYQDPASILQLHLRLLMMLYRNLPWKPTCLRLAIALRDCLRSNGIEAAVKIGLRRNNGKMIAHAWLECCGQKVLQNGIYNELIKIDGGSKDEERQD